MINALLLYLKTGSAGTSTTREMWSARTGEVELRRRTGAIRYLFFHEAVVDREEMTVGKKNETWLMV